MTEVSTMNESPITSVAQDYDAQTSNQATSLLPPILHLNLRGVKIDLDRETLVNLPESILIVMFPNGVLLSKPPSPENEGEHEQDLSNLELGTADDHIIYVDFSSELLEYILNFYQILHNSDPSHDLDLSHLFGIPSGPHSPFYGKKAFIILREELDYFPITEKQHPLLKTKCGEYLLNCSNIFDPFERNIHGGNNQAERQLVDMLCVSGFHREDQWGYRGIEPNRSTLVSISLVQLEANAKAIQSGVTQKLLLFWRKCWWDIEEIKIQQQDQSNLVRLWSRRIWTLELALL
jgi:hypothetical protein